MTKAQQAYLIVEKIVLKKQAKERFEAEIAALTQEFETILNAGVRDELPATAPERAADAAAAAPENATVADKIRSFFTARAGQVVTLSDIQAQFPNTPVRTIRATTNRLATTPKSHIKSVSRGQYKFTGAVDLFS